MQDVYLSNVVENLIGSLGENLFDPMLSPFSKKMVVVPSASMKNYLMYELAKNSALNVVAGVQFVTLSQALRAIDGKRIPSFIELSLLIENEIYKILEERSEEDEEVLRYFEVTQPKLDLRVVQFADQLSSLFTRYGIYGGQELESWQRARGWQQKMWRRIYSKESSWSYPIKELSSSRVIDFPLHLFGFSFLPKVYFDFFQQLDSHFYILSPCQHFWSDLCSGDEEENSLLANLAKASRHFAKLFEGSSFLQEDYTEQEGTFLKNIQNGMLQLQEPLILEDDSVQLHAAFSKLREVEILFEHVCGFLRTFEPKEIRVFAPDIKEYIPFIHLIFGDKLEYVIQEHEGNQNTFFHGLMHLIQIPELRFEKRAVLKLLEFPSFLERAAISQKEAELIEHWANEVKVSWGLDVANRQSYLQKELLEKEERGTWERGLEDLLQELVTGSSQRSPIDFADAELFGKFATIICSLKEKLLPFTQEKKSIPLWIKSVKDLFEKYFVLSQEDQLLLKGLAPFASIEGVFSFKSFKKILLSLNKEHSRISGSNLQVIHFASLSAGASIPTPVNCLIGMQEGVFPRPEERSSFSLLKLKEALSKSDEDRALFMEMLLSTRAHLWISYVNIDEKDGKKTQVSSVVEELKLKEISHPAFIFLEKPKAPFFKEFYFSSPFQKNEEKEEILIDLRHLSLLAKHPIQFYFNRTLQIYLEREEEGDSEFTLSHLNRALLRKSALTQPCEEVMEKEAKRLPQGAFKKPAMKKVKEESETLFSYLKNWSVLKSEVFSIELKLNCTEPLGEILPPLRIPLNGSRTATFFGKLTDLTPKGMLFHGTHHLKELVKIWPLYLIYLNLPMEGPRELLLTKNGKKLSPVPNYRELLVRYVEYYELAKQNVSPCMPDWCSSLLKGEERELEKEMRTSFESSFFPDPYINWLAARDPLPNANVLIERWFPLFQGVYDGL